MIFPPQKCPPKSVQNHPLPWSSTSRSSLNPWNSESPSHPIPRDILLSTLGSDSPGKDVPLHIHMPCLATPNGFRTDLLSHKTRDGKERVGTGKGQYVLIPSANQRELGQTQAMWWSQSFLFFPLTVLQFPLLPLSFAPVPFSFKSFPPSRVPMLWGTIPTV